MKYPMNDAELQNSILHTHTMIKTSDYPPERLMLAEHMKKLIKIQGTRALMCEGENDS